MFQVGEEYLGYSVIATDGDTVTIRCPGNITISFSRTGISGGLKEVLCQIGVKEACQ